MSSLTPEDAWREFRLSLPTPIAPARACPTCGARVPERDYIYHGEELAQMREEFLRLYSHVNPNKTLPRPPRLRLPALCGPSHPQPAAARGAAALHLQPLTQQEAMRQGFTSVTNTTDSSGNPTGGGVAGTGLTINWQDGPLGRGEERATPNGAFVEDVIEAARQRIEFYQTASGGRFACHENAIAITKLDEALLWLNKRTADRETRQVEGTHQA